MSRSCLRISCRPGATGSPITPSRGVTRRSGYLSEPNLPYQKLGIVHLTLWMKSRTDLRYPVPVSNKGV